MAYKLEVNQSTISRIEKGMHNPPKWLISKLEKLVGMSIIDLAQQAALVTKNRTKKGRAANSELLSMDKGQRDRYLYDRHSLAVRALEKRIHVQRDKLAVLSRRYREHQLLELTAKEDLDQTRDMVKLAHEGRDKLSERIIKGLEEKEKQLNTLYNTLKAKGSLYPVNTEVLQK